jgi:serpin B
MKHLLASLSVTLILVGCGRNSEPSQKPSTFARPTNADKASAGDKQTLARNNNEFALALYGRLRDREGNLFFSPFSVSTAFGMTYGGARGETAAEMAKGLHFTLPPERLHPAFAGVLWDLASRGKPRSYQLDMANALFVHKGYPLRPEFIKLTRDHYSAGLQELEFADGEGDRKTINAWVAKNTGDKINDLLPAQVIEPQTRLLMVNAAYFKADWQEKFKNTNTRKEWFRVSADKRVTVPLMKQTGHFGYWEDEKRGVQLLTMPFRGYELSMVVLLPRQGLELAELEASLTADSLAQWLEGTRETSVEVILPKFGMRKGLDLKKLLVPMGVRLVFDAVAADLTGIANVPPGESLYLTAALHQAVVEVDEEGTEAAAATVMKDKAKEGPPRPAGPVVFRADHPFLFLIRHRDTGCILFLGRLSEPQG